MEEQSKKLKELIEASNKILITSHISPDPDAVSSLLLFGTTLRTNFADKNIDMVLEEAPLGLDFLAAITDIKVMPLEDAIAQSLPELIIIVDANKYTRVSRKAGEAIKRLAAQRGIKTAIIDHHEPAGKDDSSVYINQGSPAAVQDVYEVLFDTLSYKKPDGYAQTSMTGLYSDTGGFSYANPRHTATFRLSDKLVEAGADIELIRNNLFRYSEDDLKVLVELINNTSYQADYTYSFISDEFVARWLNNGASGSELSKGTDAYVNGFLRNINGRQWGFIVYKDVLSDPRGYSASFRSVGGVKDVSETASLLGGGGHKPAAGAKFSAASIEDALAKVRAAIENTSGS